MPARPLFPLRASLPARAWLAAGGSWPPTQAGSDPGGAETISAFGELWLGVLACQRCVCGGLREEVEEGTHQGVTLFTKPGGTAEKKDKSLGTSAETAAQRFPYACAPFGPAKEHAY